MEGLGRLVFASLVAGYASTMHKGLVDGWLSNNQVERLQAGAANGAYDFLSGKEVNFHGNKVSIDNVGDLRKHSNLIFDLLSFAFLKGAVPPEPAKTEPTLEG